MAYADEWYQLHAGGGKARYARQVRNVLDRHLIPRFGDWPLDAFTERELRKFRQDFVEQVDADGARCLSNARINFMFSPLAGGLRFAEREFRVRNLVAAPKLLREAPRVPSR